MAEKPLAREDISSSAGRPSRMPDTLIIVLGLAILSWLATFLVTPGRFGITDGTPRANAAPPAHNAGGMAVPQPPLGDLVADGLVSRPDVSALETLSVADMQAIIFRFSRTGRTSGHAGRDADGARRTTIGGIMLGIRPVDVAIKEIAQ